MAFDQGLTQIELGAGGSDAEVTPEAPSTSRSWKRSAVVATALGMATCLAGGAAMQHGKVPSMASLAKSTGLAGTPGTMCEMGCCPHENYFCCVDRLNCAPTEEDCPAPFRNAGNSGNAVKILLGAGECVDGDYAPSCFPGEATVQLRGETSFRAVRDLREGDEVLVGEDAYEPVLGFLHRVGGANGYVAVTHERGVFRASANHLVFTAEGKDKRVSELQVGDAVLLRGAPSRVLSAGEEVSSAGMFAPLTASGRVVVDGVLASAYAGPAASSPHVPHAMLHALFFPARAFHATGLSTLLSVPYVKSGNEEMSALVSLYYQHMKLQKVQKLLA